AAGGAPVPRLGWAREDLRDPVRRADREGPDPPGGLGDRGPAGRGCPCDRQEGRGGGRRGLDGRGVPVGHRDRRGDLAAHLPPARPDGRQGTDPRGRVHASVTRPWRRSTPSVGPAPGEPGRQVRRTPREEPTMLRIAVPNKGSLSGPASEMLREAGYRQRRDTRELVLADPENDVEFFFLRPRDVAVYVGTGTVDVGITGRDLMLDSGADAVE